MKTLTCTFAALGLLASSLSAQWITRDYTLLYGWNGVWMAGDASHTTVGDIFADIPEVSEVWRWNPNPNQILFTTAPSNPTTHSDEWTVWKRDDIHEQGLQRMVGNSAYMIRTTAATTAQIKQRAIPPSATWLISGANFIGFPAAGNGTSAAPTFNAYFASFPSASTSLLAPGAPIYRYIGGPLSPVNPMQINTSSERVDPNRAYWFQFATVSSFTAPIEYEVPSDAGLAFGRTHASMIVGVMNRSTVDRVITVSLEPSEAAPSGQRGVVGGVALTHRTFNSETNTHDETPLAPGSSFTVTVPASGRLNLDFGVDRSELTDTYFTYASLLRLRDTAGLTDVRLPVSAEAATTAGLWGVKVRVTDVESTVPGASGTSTSQPFPLRFLMHVDQDGAARLLPQAFVGQLTSEGNPLGITISETEVLPYDESDIKPRRYVAAQLPLDHPIDGSGMVGNENTASWVISIHYNDVTNPFVHTYHPDHDNRDANQNTLPNGVESYTITRTCVFTFTSTPPDDSNIVGWGNTTLGGTYTETLTGLNRVPLHVSGTFTMARISEIGEINLTLSSD